MKCPMSRLPFNSKPHFEVKQRHPALFSLDTQDVFGTLTINTQGSVLTQGYRRAFCMQKNTVA